ACCRCGIPCTTYLFSCVYWLFGVVFALLAVVVTVLAYLSWAACGEVELQQRRQPGVFQWYLVPYCEQTFDFADINREADDAERRFSKEACKNLLKSCDNNTISFKPLLCGNDITSEDQCPNFGTMASVLSATRIKAFKQWRVPWRANRARCLSAPPTAPTQTSKQWRQGFCSLRRRQAMRALRCRTPGRCSTAILWWTSFWEP
ncbi:hypothetical protein TcCL_ESM10817, partial [Trypanosoma cruzi]